LGRKPSRTDHAPSDTERQRRRRDAFEIDLQVPGQSVAEWHGARLSIDHGEFDPQEAAAQLAGDAHDFRAENPVLQPWKAVQSHRGALPGVDTPSRQRWGEVRGQLQRTRRNDYRDLLAGTQQGPGWCGLDLSESSRQGGTDDMTLALEGVTLESQCPFQ
jgi:hypothetical protein